jgi:ferrous iron transport protein B
MGELRHAGAPASARRPAAPHDPRVVRVALAGNPNVGKSSLFNGLTGGRQHVANWPGKTVERRSGRCAVGTTELVVEDLPGTYSLAASSPEEVVAEEALAGDGVDVVAVVLDSTNLERNLYLATQLAELGPPLVLVLNLVDAATAHGTVIDDERLSATFGAPVVRTVARSGDGLEALRAALAEVGTASRPARTPPPIEYGGALGQELRRLEEAVAALPRPALPSVRWVAQRLLEQEPVTVAAVAASPGGGPVLAAADRAASRLRAATGMDPALSVADRRSSWAHQLAVEVLGQPVAHRSRTDRLDDLLTHPWLGVPVFLALMWAVFTLVVDVAAPFVGWIEAVVDGPLRRWGASALGPVALDGTWVEGLLLDGVLRGVGAVLVFVPVLALLYLALGVLEDSGYMARAAYLMDRVMTPIGLSGKSFLPLLLGFGCNVTAVYATRVLDRRRERLLTALSVPFVSCAARLPVYVLLASVFFPTLRGTVVFAMYLASIAMVLTLGAVLDRWLLRDERGGSFVLELPPYRRPSARVLGRYVGQRVGAFVRGAGSVILAAAMAVWLLLAIPVTGGSFGGTDLEDSAFAATARVVAPALAPAGLGSWELTGTLLTGMVAKEVMVATLWQVHGAGAGGELEAEVEGPEGAGPDLSGDLREIGGRFVAATRDAALAVPAAIGVELRDVDHEDASALAAPLRAGLDRTSGGHAPAAAVALLAFVLLYVPCVATVAALRQELGGRWAALSVGVSLSVAWVVATGVFQLGRALGRVLGGG